MAKARRAKGKHEEEKTEKAKGKKFGKIILILLLIIIMTVLGIFLWYNIALGETGKTNEQVTFEIPMGSGADSIATILKENNVIKSKIAFKVYVKLNSISNFQAGKYTVTKDMDVPELAEALQKGIMFKTTGFNITFVEGKTFPYIAKTIAENTDNEEQEVYDLLKDTNYLNSLIDEYWFLTDDIKNKDIYYPLEGYLFPDTYSFDERNVSVKKIFKAMLDQTEKVLSKYKTDIQTSGHSVHQIITLASLIENEAMHDEDRKDVSSVFYNRLNAKMSLGSDVTTYYAFRIEMGERDLYKGEINTYNPYNTRGPNMEGKLPCGPISTVGKASIEAAIKPNTTEYLFFVADKNGKVYFTKTNEEHEEKVNELKANNLWLF